MGIVSDVYKGFVIGEEGTPGRLYSKNYGVYINGDAVYDSPSRDADMITIPGRNGTYYKDNGRFNNITVTYRAGMFGDDQTDFAENIRAFRNAIAIRSGYQKIYDDYNTDEYRVGVYKGGLEIDPTHYSDAGQFDVVFDCKPQRFLKSGDTTYTLTSGGSIDNPTLFTSHPLLMVKGYGGIDIGGTSFNIQNIVLGQVLLTSRQGGTPQWSVQYPSGLLNNGDDITIKQGSEITINLAVSSGTISEATTTNNGSYADVRCSFSRSNIAIGVYFDQLFFKAGTASTITNPFVLSFDYRIGTSPEYTQTITFTPTLIYDSTNRRFTLKLEYTSLGVATIKSRICTIEQAMGDSTMSTLGNPSYIDCEIGEAYKKVNGQNVSINNAVSLGSTLPYLPGGTTTVTYDSTITELKIIPRWWRL